MTDELGSMPRQALFNAAAEFVREDAASFVWRF